jgi:hypothetical protein
LGRFGEGTRQSNPGVGFGTERQGEYNFGPLFGWGGPEGSGCRKFGLAGAVDQQAAEQQDGEANGQPQHC